MHSCASSIPRVGSYIQISKGNISAERQSLSKDVQGDPENCLRSDLAHSYLENEWHAQGKFGVNITNFPSVKLMMLSIGLWPIIQLQLRLLKDGQFSEYETKSLLW
jgi:hypothetical protein